MRSWIIAKALTPFLFLVAALSTWELIFDHVALGTVSYVPLSRLRPKPTCMFDSILFDESTANTTVGRFRAESFTCRRDVSNDVSHVDFFVLECPPYYKASAFQLQASTHHARMMGHVGPRYAVREGCGIYNASVPIANANNVTVELFWTSEHAHYSNRVSDISMAHKIKNGTFTEEELADVLSAERMAYLTKYLLPIQGFPVEIQVAESPSLIQEINHLPDCATVPIRQWSPVGVFVNGSHEKFGSAHCQFPNRDFQELNNSLAGLRIKYLGDSHGEKMMMAWQHMVCPELIGKNKLYQFGYECPNQTNSFQVGWRFFRGIYRGLDHNYDMDGLSAAMRHGELESCRKVLGLGLFNATIMMIPTWLFVYESQEGLNDFIIAVKSMLENCKSACPDLFSDHIFLLQSAFASDSLNYKTKKQMTGHGVPWRGIHNYKIHAFSQSLSRQLDKYVDGIIPLFSLTYARSVTMRTSDGTHWPHSIYEETIQVQATAILSAVDRRVKEGRKQFSVASRSEDDVKMRWFVGVDLQ